MLTRIEGQDGNCWEGREARREFFDREGSAKRTITSQVV